MIQIVNVGPPLTADKSVADNPLGVRRYEVRINGNVICEFQHARADGLGMCLLEASKAVERQRYQDAARILELAESKQ